MKRLGKIREIQPGVFYKVPENPIANFWKTLDEGTRESIRRFVILQKRGQWDLPLKLVLEGKLHFCPKHVAKALQASGYSGDPQDDYLNYILERNFAEFILNPESKLERKIIFYLHVAVSATAKEILQDLHAPPLPFYRALQRLREAGVIRFVAGRHKNRPLRLSTPFALFLHMNYTANGAFFQDVLEAEEIRKANGKPFANIIPKELRTLLENQITPSLPQPSL